MKTAHVKATTSRVISLCGLEILEDDKINKKKIHKS